MSLSHPSRRGHPSRRDANADEQGPRGRKLFRFVAPSLLAIAGLAAQLRFRALVDGKVFLLMFPALFAGALLGDLVPALIGTAAACFGVWYFFIPPIHSFAVGGASGLFGLAIFSAMGVIFGIFGARFRAAQVREREQQRRTEASERRFRTLAEALPQIVWITRPDGWNTYFNHQWVDYTGMSLQESYGHGWNIPFHPDDRQRAWEAWQHAVRTDGAYSLECRLRRKDGEYRWWLIRGVSLHDASGKVTDWFGTCTDVEDIKQTEEALKRARDEAEAVITESKRIEKDQRFLAEVGAALASTLDYREGLQLIAEEAVHSLADSCIVDLVEEDGQIRRLAIASADPAKAAVAEALKEVPLDRNRPHLTWSILESKEPRVLTEIPPGLVREVAQNESHARLLEGQAAVSMMGVPLIARDKLLGSILFFSSSRDRLYTERSVPLAMEFGRRAAMTIENARLYQSAQRAIRARDEVLAIVAHDLRNPLNSVAMQAALLRRGKTMEESVSRKIAESIQRSVARMDRLIQDLLDVTVIEGGRLSVERSAVPTRRLVEDAIEGQAGLVSSASLEVKAQLAPELPPVSADRDRLLQVFENLLGNAVKFTPPGGTIAVGAAPRNGEIMFWVENTGAGISPENLPHVFDRYWQARRGKRRGAGLGLPIAKGIVEAHAGHIWVESAPAQRTTFYFTVPVALQAEGSKSATVH